MSEYDPAARGANAERRFLEVCSIRTSFTPDWFLGVRRTSPYMDARGVDAYGFVKNPHKHKERTQVLIQIKSSRKRAEEYLQKLRISDAVAGVKVIVVNESMSDDEIRRNIYRILYGTWNYREEYRVLHQRIGQLQGRGIRDEKNENQIRMKRALRE